MDSKVVVTGGAGFIGSHLVDRLLKDGADVTVIDNLSSGTLDNLKQQAGNPHMTIVEGDLLDQALVTRTLRGHSLVFHLAAHSDIASAWQQRDLDLRNGLLATINTLEAMHETGVRRMLYTSSGSIYGDLRREAHEIDGPCLPISLYAASKLSAEAYVSAYAALFDMQATIVRLSNIVGNRIRRGAVYDFVKRLHHDPSHLRVLGDGQQTKPYLLVEECIDGMLRALDYGVISHCEVFNLAPDSATPVRRIAAIAIEEMGLSQIPIQYTGDKQGWPGDQTYVRLCPERMASIGWRAHSTSDEAVRIAARGFIEHHLQPA